jgi:hypothetical protein
MLNYHYSYAVGAVLYAAAWGVFFFLNRRFRNQMLLGSMLSAPFALSGFLFMPLYWHPPSLFDLDVKLGIGIEDILWSAAVGGIAAVTGEVLFRERLVPISSQPKRNVLVPIGAAVLVFAVLELLNRHTAMNNLLAGFVTGSAVIAIVRRDLLSYMLRSASAFTAVYLLLFCFLMRVYPEFVSRYWNAKALLGVYVLGVPVEELEFAFAGGALWSALWAWSRGFGLAASNVSRAKVFAPQPGTETPAPIE